MEVTICKKSKEDLIKLFFLIAIIFISFDISFEQTNVVYAAIFVQSVSNFETFWTIRENPLLDKCTKGLVTFIVISSFAAGLLSIKHWYKPNDWMNCLYVKYIFVGIVTLPILFWGRDYVLNSKAGR